MADKGAQDKTEKPTGKRRGKAREKGQVAKSAEIPSVAVLLAGFVVLWSTGGAFYEELADFLSRFLGSVGQMRMSEGEVGWLAGWVLGVFFKLTTPVMAAVVLAALAANLWQVGFLIAPSRLKPDFSRLNPLPGFQRYLSMRTLVELVKNLAKLLVVGWVAYGAVAGEWHRLPHLMDTDVGQSMAYIAQVSFRIFWRCILVMMVLAILDWAYQKFDFEKNLKMSKQEVKDEMKQNEGDPQVKSRIRSIQRDSARKRMMASVPEADVVITNPTHYAVALSYQPGEMEAPKLLAKGMNRIAEKIKETARAHHIPIVEDKPLAQALYRQVEVGQSIPFEMYETVATVLAHVYRQKNQARQVLAAEQARA